MEIMKQVMLFIDQFSKVDIIKLMAYVSIYTHI